MGLTTLRRRPQKGITPDQPHKDGDAPPPMTRTAPDGVTVGKAKKGIRTRAWRWTVNTVVVLFLFAGFMQIIGQPILRALDRTPTTTAPTTVPAEEARSVAAVAVADWLTYNPQDNTTYRSTLANRFTPGAAVNAWSGSAWMAPDVVTAGGVTQQPGTTATVEVTARVRVATPDKPAQEPGTQDNRAGSPGNDATLPAGWRVVDTQWLHLLVPVRLEAGRPAAGGSGPVFATTNPAQSVTPGVNGDTDATAASKGWATSLFTALAGTDPVALGYLTVNPIEPLNGQVQLATVNGWTVNTLGEGESTRVATATVTWKVLTVDLQVKQTYTVAATDQSGRWAATTITADTTGGSE